MACKCGMTNVLGGYKILKHIMHTTEWCIPFHEFPTIKFHADAYRRSTFDISPCVVCGEPVVCCADGMGGMCEDCVGEA